MRWKKNRNSVARMKNIGYTYAILDIGDFGYYYYCYSQGAVEIALTVRSTVIIVYVY